MTQDKNHIGMNIDTVDSARFLVLEQKRRDTGLQESEKEELKQLKEKGRQIK